MHTRLLLLGDPDARPPGLERALVRAGFLLAETELLPEAPGDSGSPDLTIVSIARVDATDAANNALSGQTADPEGDGMNNFLDYTLGGFPRFVDRKAREPIVAIENFSGQNYVTLTYTLNAGASDATVVAEVSGNLSTWSSSGANVILVSGPTTNPNGSVTRKVRDATATTAAAQRYIRLKSTGP